MIEKEMVSRFLLNRVIGTPDDINPETFELLPQNCGV